MRFDIDQRQAADDPIHRQPPDHHEKVDFKTEYLGFLDAHGIGYDIRHVFD